MSKLYQTYDTIRNKGPTKKIFTGRVNANNYRVRPAKKPNTISTINTNMVMASFNTLQYFVRILNSINPPQATRSSDNKEQ